MDYEQYEAEVEKIEKANKEHISTFEKYQLAGQESDFIPANENICQNSFNVFIRLATSSGAKCHFHFALSIALDKRQTKRGIPSQIRLAN